MVKHNPISDGLGFSSSFGYYGGNLPKGKGYSTSVISAEFVYFICRLQNVHRVHFIPIILVQ